MNAWDTAVAVCEATAINGKPTMYAVENKAVRGLYKKHVNIRRHDDRGLVMKITGKAAATRCGTSLSIVDLDFVIEFAMLDRVRLPKGKRVHKLVFRKWSDPRGHGYATKCGKRTNLGKVEGVGGESTTCKSCLRA